MQTKTSSLVEAVTNQVAGYLVSVLITMFILGPMIGYDIGLRESVSITIIYSIASIVRGYLFRRLFNHISTRR